MIYTINAREKSMNVHIVYSLSFPFLEHVFNISNTAVDVLFSGLKPCCLLSNKLSLIFINLIMYTSS